MFKKSDGQPVLSCVVVTVQAMHCVKQVTEGAAILM